MSSHFRKLLFYAKTLSSITQLETLLSTLNPSARCDGSQSLDESKSLAFHRLLLTVDRHKKSLWRILDVPFQVYENRCSVPRMFVLAGRFLERQSFEFSPEIFSKFLVRVCAEEALTVEETIRSLHYLELRVLLTLSQQLAQSAAASTDQALSPLVAVLTRISGSDQNGIIASAIPFENILRQDPGSVYECMDLPTKNMYRQSIAKIGREVQTTGADVAMHALRLANQSARAGKGPLESHIGYFICAEGRKRLCRSMGHNTFGKFESIGDSMRAVEYIGILSLLSFAAAVLTMKWIALPIYTASFWVVLACVLLLANEAMSAIFRDALRYLIPRRQVPSMNCWHGIPDSSRTVIGVPTILISESQIAQVIRRMSDNFLVAREKNLYMILLVDFEDADMSAPTERESRLLQFCINSIGELNRFHFQVGHERFVVASRDRQYSKTEQTWMGWERKRGKISALFDLISTGKSELNLHPPPHDSLRNVRYVLALDDDSLLTPLALQALVGSMSHPLNYPNLEETKRNISRGYGVMVPLMEPRTSQTKNLLTMRSTIFDWFDQCAYPGKGLFNVEVCAPRLRALVPEGKILSHDTFEGMWIRPGFLATATITESSPSSYVTLGERGHRWIRGDWQNWLIAISRAFQKPPVSVFSWLTLCRQIRSSLIPVAETIALVVTALAGGPAGILVLMFVYWWLKIAEKIVILLWFTPKTARMRAVLKEFRNLILMQVIRVANAPHRALVNADAILRVGLRMLRHRRLLEWRSAEHVEIAGASISISKFYLAAIPLASVVTTILLKGFYGMTALSYVFLVTWMVSPIGLLWIRRAPTGHAASR